MVEKSELLKVVWPDTFVEEGGLTRNIPGDITKILPAG